MEESYWLTKNKHLAFTNYVGGIFGPLDLHKINATYMFYVIDLLHNAQILMRFGKAFSTFLVT